MLMLLLHRELYLRFITRQHRMLLFVAYLTVCIYDAQMCEVAMGLEDHMVTPTVSLSNCICKGRLLKQIP